MAPKHLRQIPENRQAIAPYNFVELADRVVEVTEDYLPKSNCYDPKRHTGKIDCTLTTSSPLYIRCGLTTEEFKDGKEAKELPDFFHTNPNTKTQKPVIPGSSLRGMLRTLVEIISFSKIERVSARQHFFFRAVATTENDDSLAQAYKKYINPQNVKAGYLKKEGERWFIFPAKSLKGVTFAWVKEEDLSTVDFPKLIKMDEPGYLPQHIPVSFKNINKNKNNRYFAEDVSPPNSHPMNNGMLVSSGNMKQSDDYSKKTTRRNHCIVFQQSPSPHRLEIDPVAVQHYCDALTEFQKSNPFDSNLGVLQDSLPIFYCQPQQNEKVITLFGHSPNFRIPYSPQGDGKAASAVDFIPDGLGKSDKIDLADAIFGFIKDKQPGEEQAKARSGRVFISDGICEQTTPENLWLTENTITPKILASPKPTTFQHYLVQTSYAKNDLKHYASKPDEGTIIRGHKLYWHKGSSPAIKHENPDDVSDTQKTEIKPIKPGVDFQFTIYFDNLTHVELGALLWVLDLAKDQKYRLSLGMGKPLGMGAVKIESKLYLSKRNRRYSSLFDGLNWAIGEEFEDNLDYPILFENYVLEKIRQTGKFRDIERIQMLLAMLSWQDSPSADKTRYMEIERQQQPLDGDPNEYKTRRVLPTPLQVIEKPGGSRPVRRSPITPQNQESPRITASPPVNLPQSDQANTFCDGQIVEATVLYIVTKVIDGKKNKTTITYQVNGLKLGKTEELYKKSISLAIGDVVTLRITEVKNGNIKKYERLE
ncbi:TIGR03986 family CRISPR-associated RAMP protein [Microcoleus sp. CAWBG58]|uniref:TIGR03986 family type III CRISPR-associated RAMP protein n=1 Tax=Microcoleus sp. CAWBG58 TaxID=2841651 RepID=UPI0025D8031A|nr:TIGR03986 family CRISPR-associated RAMP protein [Microcoleus sp. CAWBG58]